MRQLRISALLAGAAQAFICYETVRTYFISPAIVFDPKGLGWLWGGINVFSSCSILIVFLALVCNPVPLRVPGALKKVSLTTIIAIALQNLPISAGNFRAIVARSRNPLQWQYHPIDQLWHVVEPLFPTAWVVLTIIFLFAASRLPRIRKEGTGTPGRHVPTVLAAALLGGTGAAAELAGATYMMMRFRLFTIPSFLQLAIDTSFVLFFLVLCRSERLTDFGARLNSRQVVPCS